MLQQLRLNGQACVDRPSVRSIAHRSKHHVRLPRHFVHAEFIQQAPSTWQGNGVAHGARIQPCSRDYARVSRIALDKFRVSKLKLDMLRLWNRFVVIKNSSPQRYFLVTCARKLGTAVA